MRYFFCFLLLASSFAVGCDPCPTGEALYGGSSLEQGLVVAGILGQNCYSLDRAIYVQEAQQGLPVGTENVHDLGRELLDVEGEQSRITVNAGREPSEQFINAGRYLACLVPFEPEGTNRWNCLSFDLQVGERVALRAYSAGSEYIELYGQQGLEQISLEFSFEDSVVPCQEAERFIHACNPTEEGLNCAQWTIRPVGTELAAELETYFRCVSETIECTAQQATWSEACVFPETPESRGE